MIPRFISKGHKKVGAPPGTLMHIGKKHPDAVRITVMDYGPDHAVEETLPSIDAVGPFFESDHTSWINIEGLHDLEIIERFGSLFGVHPLTLEDIVNTGQRPKFEDYDDYLFIVFKMLRFKDESMLVVAEQISLVLTPRCLFSFQEKKGDVFEYVRERIRKGKGRIRKYGCDYLAYALLDAVVDHYFVILERIGEDMEDLEAELLDTPRAETLHTIHKIKREMIYLRKQVWPLRDVINQFARGESFFVRDETDMFLRDVYDHTIQIIDSVESFRDILSGMIDLYLSTVSNRMNEVMKVLTIIATLFIPITFIAGVYGMNFKYMPELEWRWGYVGIWGIMIGLVIMMLLYFRKRKWF